MQCLPVGRMGVTQKCCFLIGKLYSKPVGGGVRVSGPESPKTKIVRGAVWSAMRFVRMKHGVNVCGY